MSRRALNIAIFGAPINNGNLGCQALTYSLINLLENIANENAYDFYYHIFEWNPDENKTRYFCERLCLDQEKINCHKRVEFYLLHSYVKHMGENLSIIRLLKKCDLAIDMTEGDSFADIYGDNRFISGTRMKLAIERLGIPYILGPQTYGPFNNESNKELASKVIKKASKVITRDMPSARLIKDISDIEAEVTTDLAFQLPFDKSIENRSNKLRVGVNISGLLVMENMEQTNIQFKLATDYDLYIQMLLNYLTTDSNYEVFLIPHVQPDTEAINKYLLKYPSCHTVAMFADPIEAKSFISTMDIFIGARMHATIAAYTSGVLTIPTAYSRKFKGLFDLVNYDHTIDLLSLTTEEAAELTFKKLESLGTLKEDMQKSLELCELYSQKTKQLFLDAINCI